MKKVLLLTLLLLSKALFAQVPANDECANATLLTPSTSCIPVTGTIANATTSTITPSCGGSKDVFYRFVANATTATVNVTGSAGLDVEIATFSACGATSLACVDATVSGQTETIAMTGLVIGNTYYIKVQDWTTGAASTFTFTICVISAPVTPVNDECANATLLTTSTTCSPITGTIANATTSTITPSCGGSKDVFYRFVANAPTATVNVTGSAGLDVEIATFSGCGTTSLACVDATVNGQTESIAMTGLVIGNTYYVKVQDWTTNAATTYTFTICVVSTPVTPVNDECATATLLTPSTTCNPVTGTIANATTSTITPSCGYYRDVFYKFVANAPTAAVTVVGSTGLDPVVATFAACGGTSINCQDNSNAGGTETVNMTGLTVGSTYFIKVQHYFSTVPTTSTFTICVVSTPIAVPVNDECATATLLTPSSICSPVTGTIANATTSTITPSCGGSKDVFYRFVANATTATVNVTGSAGLDVEIATFAGCGATSLACVDATVSGQTETIAMTGLVIGNTYYVKVQDWTTNAATTYTFTICVVSSPPSAPVNDECANATLLTTYTTCNPVTGTIANATTSTITPSCGGSKDVFYRFVANAPTATVNVTGSAGLDVEIATFSGCGTTSLACVDATVNGQTESIAMTGLVIGNTYYVKVQDWTSNAATTYTFTICVVSTPVTPVNDECANATLLTPSTTCNPVTGTIANATTSTITPSCGGSKDVFYRFVANAPTATVTVTGSSGLDVEVATFTGCGTTSFTCVDLTFNGEAETVSMSGLTIGNTYYIKVQDYSSGGLATTYPFTICVVSIPAVTTPVNDVCASATTLTPSTSCASTTGVFTGATSSGVTNSCTGYSDVFYKFVANATTATVTSTPGSGVDVVLSVMTSCASATSLACIDNATNPSATETASLTGLTIGTTYYIKVQNYSTTLPTTATFTICVVSNPVVGPPPANDACANAITLTPAATCVPTSGTLANATNSTLTTCPGNYDVFYKFTATATSATVRVTPSSALDPVLGVFTSCAATSSLACEDNGIGTGIAEVATLTGLTIGTQYFVKVSSYGATVPTASTTFTICVQNSTTTGTQSSTALSAISLYPNPTQNVLNIENISMDTKIELIDLTGKTIFVQDLSADMQVDLSDYSAGVYILKLTSGGASENRRVVLSK